MLQGKIGLDDGSRMTQSFFAVRICRISDMRIDTLARVTTMEAEFFFYVPIFHFLAYRVSRLYGTE